MSSLIVYADGRPVDIAALYREAGHTVLPTTPTIAPWQLSSIVPDTADREWWIEAFEGQPSRALDRNAPICVKDGMAFSSVPRGSYYRGAA